MIIWRSYDKNLVAYVLDHSVEEGNRKPETVTDSSTAVAEKSSKWKYLDNDIILMYYI